MAFVPEQLDLKIGQLLGFIEPAAVAVGFVERDQSVDQESVIVEVRTQFVLSSKGPQQPPFVVAKIPHRELGRFCGGLLVARIVQRPGTVGQPTDHQSVPGR